MSEELIQKKLQDHGERVGDYEYYNIGQTTLNQLKGYDIIPKRDYGSKGNKKPDALLVDRRHPKNIQVKVVVEFKSAEEFSTEAKKNRAIKQCIENYCNPLKSPIGVVTDGTQYIWINPKAAADNRIILREDGYPLDRKMSWDTEEEAGEILDLIGRLVSDLAPENSQLLLEEYRNPSTLATRVWQKIWLASGENPDACLATFVEIFVFKYLSDLGVLNKNSSAVPVSFEDVIKVDENEVLKYYTSNVREAIKTLFPPSMIDDTSVINGSVLNPELSEHNKLFKDILKDFKKFGTLRNIDPEFKSRLYETFLKNSISQKNWGQFFTPRNIIKAMIEISGIESLPDGSLVHDPACGVGGFILEPLLSKRDKDFTVSGSVITPKIMYSGYDRDRKTIILAKANMLIHLNELVKKNPTITSQFSDVFNSTFKQIRDSTLGSLSMPEKELYDLILTNPPFVVNGTSTIKKTIKREAKLSSFFAVNGQGVEGLFLELIIRSLKKGGTIVTVVPDGVLNRGSDSKLRKFIRDQCFIEAIISLPINSFYTTPKKTYILVLKKKTDFAVVQSDPVFTYLVKDIGETLDVKRFKTANDLIEMARLYKYFRADKLAFVSSSEKCKTFPISSFDPSAHWSVDRWWTVEERQLLGILNTANDTDVGSFVAQSTASLAAMQSVAASLSAQPVTVPKIKNEVPVYLGDKRYFKLKLGKRVLKEETYESKGEIPLYSANVRTPFGFTETSNTSDFSKPSVLWSIDSDFDASVVEAGVEFGHTDHCGRMTIEVDDIDPYFVSYSLLKLRETFDRSFRSSIVNMNGISILLPVRLNRYGKPLVRHVRSSKSGKYEKVYVFDLKNQGEIASYYREFDRTKSELRERFEDLMSKHLPYL